MQRNVHLRYLALFAVAVVALMAAAGAQGAYTQPGPAVDAAGNLVDTEWVYRAKRISTYQFDVLNSINAAPVVVPQGGYSTVSLPMGGTGDDFDFRFYGEPVDEVFVHSDGFVSFYTSAAPSPLNPTMPPAGPPSIEAAGLPRTMVAPFWTPLDFEECGGRIYSRVDGTAPTRTFTVQWTDMVHRSQASGSCPAFPTRHTFQVVFFEGDDVFEFRYQTATSQFLSNFPPPGTGGAVTVGAKHDAPAWPDGSATPLHLEWGSGIGYQTHMSFSRIRFFPNHDPAPPTPVLVTTGEDEPLIFHLAGSDQDGDRIARYNITDGDQWKQFVVVPPSPVPPPDPMPLQYGALDCTQAPKCTYTPYPDRYGVERLMFQAKDRISYIKYAGCPDPDPDGPCPASVEGTWGPFQYLNITVLPVNDGPAFQSMPSVTAMERAGTTFIEGFAWDFHPGPTDPMLPAPFNESDQSLVDFVVSIAPNPPDPPQSAWFLIQPDVMPSNGTLYWAIKPGRCGPLTLRVQLMDDGGTLNDGTDLSAMRTVPVTIDCFSNSPPYLASDDPIPVLQGDPLFLATELPLRDDHDWPNLPVAPGKISLTLLDEPARGDVWRDGAPVGPGATFTGQDLLDGDILYQNDGLSAGSDEFRLLARDSFGALGILTVPIDILPVSDPPPVARRIVGLVLPEAESRMIRSDLLSFDDGAGSVPIDVRYTVLSGPARGTLTLDGAAVTTFTEADLRSQGIRYTHNAATGPGEDAFTFRVRDLAGNEAVTRTFPIEVMPYDGGPIPVNPLIERFLGPGEQLTFLYIAQDAEEDPFECLLAGAPVGATLERDSCQFRWRPTEADVGEHRFEIVFRETVEPAQETRLQVVIIVLEPNDPFLRIADGDRDGVPDYQDNCPGTINEDQADRDKDGTGDACDVDSLSGFLGSPIQYSSLDARDLHFPDGDHDGIIDPEDNCTGVFNHDQRDSDGDGVGDACDTDMDNDGVADEGPGGDNCVGLPNADQADLDGDGWGDLCDVDVDGDDVADRGPDASDNCPRVANEDQTDSDGDGIGDACEEPEPLQGRGPTESNVSWWPWTIAAAGLALLGTGGWMAIQRRR